jgi:hypothetical protein
MNNYNERTANGTVFAGSDVNTFYAAVIAATCKSYAKQLTDHGSIIINLSGTTPTSALAIATSFTKKPYKMRRNAAAKIQEFTQAYNDVQAVLDSLKDRIVL